MLKMGKSMITTMTAIMVLSSVSVSYAAAEKTPTIFYNNQKVTSDKKPFISNGTTYIPLRMMADLFGKDLTFDPKTYYINVTDKPTKATTSDSTATIDSNAKTDTTSSATGNDESTAINNLQQQITQTNQLILTLEEKLNQLQNNTSTQIPTTTQTTTTAQAPAVNITDLQSLLNGSSYLTIRSFQLGNISVYGDSSQINIEIDTALQGNGNLEHWNDLTTDDLNTYFSTISSKIRQYYPSASITGKVKNTSYIGNSSSSDPSTTTQYIAVFTTASDGTVNVSKLY